MQCQGPTRPETAGDDDGVGKIAGAGMDSVERDAPEAASGWMEAPASAKGGGGASWPAGRPVAQRQLLSQCQVQPYWALAFFSLLSTAGAEQVPVPCVRCAKDLVPGTWRAPPRHCQVPPASAWPCPLLPNQGRVSRDHPDWARRVRAKARHARPENGRKEPPPVHHPCLPALPSFSATSGTSRHFCSAAESGSRVSVSDLRLVGPQTKA